MHLRLRIGRAVVALAVLACLGCVAACKHVSTPPPASPAQETTVSLYPEIAVHLDAFLAEGTPPTIDQERLLGLEPLVDWIVERQRAGREANLVFVCTHNSRRSQLAQAWAQAAALHLGLDQVGTWSGGTEATAFNPRAVQALRGHGFHVQPTAEAVAEGNPVYTLGYGPAVHDRAFSKLFSDRFNPQQDFAAVMVCSSADSSCPYVEGADLRISVPYLDPKVSDDTPEEAATYAAKSAEIGREMAWVMAAVRGRL